MFKLVLIDDDAEVLAINQKYLTGAGFTVYTAISPREGVLSIRKNLPDCILLDVMLPEADGYRVCRYIRSFSSVPILFLTARSSEEDVIRGLTCGGDDYLVKPYSLRELKARVDLLIRRRRQLAQASSDLVLTIRICVSPTGNMKSCCIWQNTRTGTSPSRNWERLSSVSTRKVTDAALWSMSAVSANVSKAITNWRTASRPSGPKGIVF
mgnify:CR=1 FL=1